MLSDVNPNLLFLQRGLFNLTVLIFCVWLICFFEFFSSIPSVNSNKTKKADAIIVLTGGTKRLAAGFDLLLRGRADLLFVSGVNETVNASDIMKLSWEQGLPLNESLIKCCVFLGYNAHDTRGNAMESGEWIDHSEVNSIFLVTSNYHMRRSHLEFSLRMPNLKMSKYPVVTNNVRLQNWWLHPGSMQVLFSEYHKFILSAIRSLFRGKNS